VISFGSRILETIYSWVRLLVTLFYSFLIMKRPALFVKILVWLISITTAFAIGWKVADSNQPTLATETAKAPKPTEQVAALKSQQTGTAESEEVSSEANQLLAANLDGIELSLPELLTQIGNLTASETRLLLAEAFSLPLSNPERGDIINSLLTQLAETAPLEAIEQAELVGSLRGTQRAKVAILEIWGKNDPAAALTWAKASLSTESRNLRGSLLTALFRGYGATNPKAALETAKTMGNTGLVDARQTTRLMQEVIETQVRAGNVVDAKLSIELLDDGSTKDSLLHELVGEWASFDPLSAAAYVESLGDSATTQIKSQLIGEWAESDPASAASWLSQLDESDPVVARAAADIIREWTRYDLYASAEWLNSLPASPELDRAVASYTFRAAQEDAATAMTWAESVTDDRMRTRIMQSVAGSWKEQDSEAFESYLDTSGLDEEQKKLLQEARPSGRWGGGYRGPGPR